MQLCTYEAAQGNKSHDFLCGLQEENGAWEIFFHHIEMYRSTYYKRKELNCMKRKRKLKQFLSVMFAFLMVLSSMSLTPLKTKAMIRPLRDGVMESLSWPEGSGSNAVLKVEMLVPEELNIDFNLLEFFGSTVDIQEMSSIEDCEAIMTPEVGVNMSVT